MEGTLKPINLNFSKMKGMTLCCCFAAAQSCLLQLYCIECALLFQAAHQVIRRLASVIENIVGFLCNCDKYVIGLMLMFKTCRIK